MNLATRVLTAASFLATLAVAPHAFADEPTSPSTTGPASPDYAQKTGKPEYTAPMSQQTQPSYVPQSVAMSGPSEISGYKEGAPVPPGYTPVERVRKGMIIAGGSIFAGLYFFSALIAAAGEDAKGSGGNEVAALWIPGIGPFAQMANTKSATANVFLAVDGVGQCAGIAMAIYGIASPKTVLVRNDLVGSVRAVPIVGNGTTGLGLVGTF
jgi:hypothetical protein